MHSCHSIRRKHTTQHSDHLQKRCGALDALIEASTDMFIKLQDLLLHSGCTVRSLIVIVYIVSCALIRSGCCNDLELISQLDDMQKSERHVYERGWVKVRVQQRKAKLQYQKFVLQYEVKQNEADHSGQLNRAKESQKWPTTFRQSAMGVSIAEAGTRTAFLIRWGCFVFPKHEHWCCGTNFPNLVTAPLPKFTWGLHVLQCVLNLQLKHFCSLQYSNIDWCLRYGSGMELVYVRCPLFLQLRQTASANTGADQKIVYLDTDGPGKYSHTSGHAMRKLYR